MRSTENNINPIFVSVGHRVRCAPAPHPQHTHSLTHSLTLIHTHSHTYSLSRAHTHSHTHSCPILHCFGWFLKTALCSLDTATALVSRCCRFRVPEPVRQADQRSRTFLREAEAEAEAATHREHQQQEQAGSNEQLERVKS